MHFTLKKSLRYAGIGGFAILMLWAAYITGTVQRDDIDNQQALGNAPSAPASYALGSFSFPDMISQAWAAISGTISMNNNRVTDVATPINNKDAANREWVNAQVGAAGGGGGGTYEAYGTTSCAAGYSVAYTGTMVTNITYIGTVSGGGGVACVQGFSDIYYGTYGAYWSAKSQYVNAGSFTCVVCVPSTTAGGGAGVGAGSTVIYYVPNTRLGNLGGRSGADATCNASIPTGIQGEITNVHAFLSVATNDEIRDMHTADPDNDNVVKAWYEAGLPVYAYSRQRDAFEKIADNWTDLLDGYIDTPLTTANFPAGYTWWSGSYNDGWLNPNTCNTWTTGSGNNGRRGFINNADAAWMDYDNPSCDYSSYLLCAAKSGT